MFKDSEILAKFCIASSNHQNYKSIFKHRNEGFTAFFEKIRSIQQPKYLTVLVDTDSVSDLENIPESLPVSNCEKMASGVNSRMPIEKCAFSGINIKIDNC